MNHLQHATPETLALLETIAGFVGRSDTIDAIVITLVGEQADGVSIQVGATNKSTIKLGRYAAELRETWRDYLADLNDDVCDAPDCAQCAADAPN